MTLFCIFVFVSKYTYSVYKCKVSYLSCCFFVAFLFFFSRAMRSLRRHFLWNGRHNLHKTFCECVAITMHNFLYLHNFFCPLWCWISFMSGFSYTLHHLDLIAKYIMRAEKNKSIEINMELQMCRRYLCCHIHSTNI